MARKIRVTVWNEFRHEKKPGPVAEVYPKGIHEAIAAHLRTLPDMEVRTATLDEPSHGLTDEVLEKTDVLTWWGHMAHGEVDDKIAAKVKERVLKGMGYIALHSAHMAKPFLGLMGTSGALKWREDGLKEILWVTKPGHPITQGIDDHIVLEHEEMYGEHFDIPDPEEQIFISWFGGGEVFRSGCTWQRGSGKVFYFRPGHESFPTYFDKNVQKVITNAVRWAAPAEVPTNVTYWHYKSIV
ncbi:MAG TPA: ThuA domain-containing protein [Planctomycetota bacterium]|jgi:trehalose utilization protein